VKTSICLLTQRTEHQATRSTSGDDDVLPWYRLIVEPGDTATGIRMLYAPWSDVRNVRQHLIRPRDFHWHSPKATSASGNRRFFAIWLFKLLFRGVRCDRWENMSGAPSDMLVDWGLWDLLPEEHARDNYRTAKRDLQ